MSFNPHKPYDELADLPPTVEVETKRVLRSCIEARAALAELRVSGALIPNQSLLINLIPVIEAQASSEVENIVTTTDRLFRYANVENGRSDPATIETLRYRTALHRGIELLQRTPLSSRTAIEVCQTITGIQLDIRTTPGTALVNDLTGEVVYTPPEGEGSLRQKLSNWERFIHTQDEMDPLVRMALMHYQFEAIHPFLDGNGRTGRVLNLLYLVERGLLDTPVLYLSRYIIQNKTSYYQLLLKVTTEGAWEPWILFVLDAVKSTASATTATIHEIRTLLDETAARIRRTLPKFYSRELVELIFVNPYCRINDVVRAGIAKRQTASVYLRELADAGFLGSVKAGREVLYINSSLINLLA